MMTEGRRPPPNLAWLQAIRTPQCALNWSMPEWERVVRQGRRLRLLSRLAEGLATARLIDRVPVQARRHLVAELRLSRSRIQAIAWTLERMEAAFADARYPRVLLKGAAYIGQQLPIAKGRLPSDLDILVPLSQLQDAVLRLQQAGWSAVELDEHDSRYYHEWSHEVPPMRHSLYPVELDLHHNILPPGRVNIDAKPLLDKVLASRWTSWQVLCPVDQSLHSAAHLFFDAEPRDRVRDLVDLDGLFRHFGDVPGFWDELPKRACLLGLLEPLALACHFTQSWLDTPIPVQMHENMAAAAPRAARMRWLVPLMEAVLMPSDPNFSDSAGKRLATTVVMARYHLHRLPIRVLVPHLWRKWRARAPHVQEVDASERDGR